MDYNLCSLSFTEFRNVNKIPDGLRNKVLQLYIESFQAYPWTYSDFIEHYVKDHSCYLCYSNKKVVGALFGKVFKNMDITEYVKWENDKWFHISYIAVDEQLQHRGIGSKLLNILEDNLIGTKFNTIHLFCECDKLNFYKRNGFRILTICFGVCQMIKEIHN